MKRNVEPRQGVKQNLVDALRKLQEVNNQENAWELVLAAARAFRQGSGLTGPELDEAMDEAYPKKP